MAITLKAARVNSGLTQKEAAKELKISKTTLANYEMGKSKPTIETAVLMSKLYGLSLDDLLFLK